MLMPFMTSPKDNSNISIVVLGEESDGDGYGFLVAVASHAIYRTSIPQASSMESNRGERNTNPGRGHMAKQVRYRSAKVWQ